MSSERLRHQRRHSVGCWALQQTQACYSSLQRLVQLHTWWCDLHPGAILHNLQCNSTFSRQRVCTRGGGCLLGKNWGRGSWQAIAAALQMY